MSGDPAILVSCWLFQYFSVWVVCLEFDAQYITTTYPGKFRKM